MTPYWGRVLAACAWLIPVFLLLWYALRWHLRWMLGAALPPLYVALTYVWFAHRTIIHDGDIDVVIVWFQTGQIVMALSFGILIYAMGQRLKG